MKTPSLSRTHARCLRHCFAVLAAITGLVAAPAAGLNVTTDDAFAFFAPWVRLSNDDRERLTRGEAVVRTLPATDGQLAIFAATRLNASPDALVAWTRAIADLKRSRFVQAIGRFSDPPAVTDLDGLVLDEEDLETIRTCTPGNCKVKLSAPEIESLRRAAAAAGDDWREAIVGEFRRVLVARIERYRAGGLSALPPTASRSTPLSLHEAFGAILDASPYMARVPDLAAWLRHYPKAADVDLVDTFFYWSKESYGAGKPVISITHVGIARPSGPSTPEVLVAGKQIFAAHYMDGSLGLTGVVHDASQGVNYLVYLNRSQIDLLRGFFGGLRRAILERRVAGDTPAVVSGLRERLESGPPPG